MNVLKYGLATVVLVALSYTGTQMFKKPPERDLPVVLQTAAPGVPGAPAPNAAAPRDTVITERLVTFAETLIGTPYNYGCAKPETGFDCSGFISYVFSHFGFTVPRSSVDFTNVGTEVPVTDAKRGDLILFTGTNNAVRVVGHMGIVTSNTDSLRFIHSTSGKEYAVTITPLNEYYQRRFMKVVRVFDDAGKLAL